MTSQYCTTQSHTCISKGATSLGVGWDESLSSVLETLLRFQQACTADYRGPPRKLPGESTKATGRWG